MFLGRGLRLPKPVAQARFGLFSGLPHHDDTRTAVAIGPARDPVRASGDTLDGDGIQGIGRRHQLFFALMGTIPYN
jgi:hypothetical protein